MPSATSEDSTGHISASTASVGSTRPPDLSKVLPKLTPRRHLTPSSPRTSTTSSITTSGDPVTPTLPPPLVNLTASEAEQFSSAYNQVHYIHPTRRILSPADHALFLASPTYTLITAFIFHLSDSVIDTPISASADSATHPTVSAISTVLDALDAAVDAYPPAHNNGSRFGNPVFRDYMSTLRTNLIPSLHAQLFPSLPAAARDELSTYLLASLGSPERIDYGSGHELHFAIYLLCLYQLGLLAPRSQAPSFTPSTATHPPQQRTILATLTLRTFPHYIRLLRRLQSTYYLEPAGSHGVWGLDDYHFLPLLFGSAQLSHHSILRPRSIHSAAMIDDYAHEYLYLDHIRHLNASKTVDGLRWHSPMLDDISGVKQGWTKIYAGMKKMFLGEVLGKLVVMQHFLFGGLVPAPEPLLQGAARHVPVEEHVHRDGSVHTHGEEQGKTWSDCCGIRVPGNAGAAGEAAKGASGLRRLPFD